MVNIGLEGIMLIGAFFAMLLSYLGQQMSLPKFARAVSGAIGTVIFGLPMSMLHGGALSASAPARGQRQNHQYAGVGAARLSAEANL